MNKSKKIWIISVFLVFLIPCLVYLLSFKTTAFNINFYASEFDKYGTGIDNDEIIAHDLISFLEQKENKENLVSYFRADEISHLLDVKKVIHRFLFIMNIAGILSLFCVFYLYHLSKKNFVKIFAAILSAGGFLTLFLSFLTYLMLRNFNFAFIRFHEIFFAGNCQFPPHYLLIRLFPEQFWIDISSKILSKILVSSSILIVVGILILLMLKYFKEKDR